MTEDRRTLQAQIEELERKYETMRLATLEWGKDVEKLQIRSDRHLQRIEALESVRAYEPASTGSLLERVSRAIDRSICPDQWLHQDAARAAIREVAIWMMERGYRTQALLLNEEADTNPTGQEDFDG
jgi:hypothetical protein